MRNEKRLDLYVGGIYRVIEKIGCGTFGEIYKGVNVKSKEKVAIKIECAKGEHDLLFNEAKIYNEMAGAPGIPEIFYVGAEGEYNVLVMELLGPNLEELKAYCNGKLSLGTTLMIADQLIARTEHAHKNHYLHRDLKPNNFVIGTGSRSGVIYAIDFGLSKCFKDKSTGKHIPYRDNKQLVGTVRFASINAHLGIELSRRDDLESIGYSLVYLHSGSLPWQDLPIIDKSKNHELVTKCKVNTSISKLCKGFPSEFKDYFRIVRELKFEQKPDYQQLRTKFKDLFYKKEYDARPHFDWVIKSMKDQIKRRENPKEVEDFREVLKPSIPRKDKAGPDRKDFLALLGQHKPRTGYTPEEKKNPNENEKLPLSSLDNHKCEEALDNDETPRLANPVALLHKPALIDKADNKGLKEWEDEMEIPSERSNVNQLAPLWGLGSDIKKRVMLCRSYMGSSVGIANSKSVDTHG